MKQKIVAKCVISVENGIKVKIKKEKEKEKEKERAEESNRSKPATGSLMRTP